MGSDSSKLYIERELPRQFKQLKGHPNIYENILTGFRLRKYELLISDESELVYQKDVFMFRRLHAEHLITAYYFENTNSENFCTQNYRICYFIEQPAQEFGFNRQVTTEQAFRMLVECLKGFELLFKKFGPFPVTHQQICFDIHGTLKVWVSSEFSKTRVPESNLSEYRMIQEIFDIFDVLTDERGQQMNFNAYLYRVRQRYRANVTFKCVLAYLIDQAAKFFLQRQKKQHKPVDNFVSNRASLSRKNQQRMSNPISLKNTKKQATKTPINSLISHQIQTPKCEKPSPKIEQCEAKKSKRHNSYDQVNPKENNRFIKYYNSSIPTSEGKFFSTAASSNFPFQTKGRVGVPINVRRSADHIEYNYSKDKCNDQIQRKYVHFSSKAPNSGETTSKNSIGGRESNPSATFENHRNSKMLLLDSGKLMANIQTIKSIPDSDQLVIDSGIRLDMEMMGLTEMGESVVLE